MKNVFRRYEKTLKWGKWNGWQDNDCEGVYNLHWPVTSKNRLHCLWNPKTNQRLRYEMFSLNQMQFALVSWTMSSGYHRYQTSNIQSQPRTCLVVTNSIDSIPDAMTIITDINDCVRHILRQRSLFRGLWKADLLRKLETLQNWKYWKIPLVYAAFSGSLPSLSMLVSKT